MKENRFDTKKLAKLNNPERLIWLPTQYLINKLAMDKISVIVDIGAGTGFYSAEFAKLYKQTIVYACDVSTTMVDWMKENISPNYENIIPMVMEDSKISLFDSLADVVLMVYVHHELDNHIATLKECYRLLRKGGKVIISDWKKVAMEFGPPLEIRYETSKVRSQLEEVGFCNIQTFEDLEKNFVVVAEKV